MSPIITGLVVSGRAGAGIGAELAAMKVSEQIDAIESLSVDSFKLLVVTRVVACILVLPLLTVFMDFSSLAGGFLAFLSGYLGLAVSFLPFVVPYSITYEDAASSPAALGLMLIGTLVLLPVILGYTAWVYWIFRGKVGADAGYH